MNDIIEVCGCVQNCSNEIFYACICGDPVVFMCKDCMHIHLSNPSAHTFIPLNQARELISNRISLSEFNHIISRYNNAKSEVQSYIRSIKDFKLEIEAFKHEVISHLEQACGSALSTLTHHQDQSETLLTALNQRLKTFTNSQDELLEQFEASGLSGLIENYHQKFEINKSQVFRAIENSIVLRAPSQPIIPLEENKLEIPAAISSQILFPKYDTKKILKYDSLTNQTLEYGLASTVSKTFEFSSTCILPDSSIMIVGGAHNGDTYRFNPATGECLKLSSLNFPRKCITLYYHAGFVYAFGGYITAPCDKAERLELNGNRWEILPSMKEARSVPGVLYNDGRLYLFGGKESSSVEFYEFRSESFEIVQGLKVPVGGSVAGMMDDKIYIVSKNLTVLSLDMRIVEQNKNFSETDFWNLSGVAVKGKGIIFYCSNYNTINMFNTQTKTLRTLMSI
jgi:hypothetical protein